MLSGMINLQKQSTNSQCYYCGKSFLSKVQVNKHLEDSHSTIRGKKSVVNVVRSNPQTPNYVVNFLETSQNYCVCLVDIVNSTEISASLTQQKLSKYYEIFLNSMAQIVESFGGFVIKNIGDSLLFYFPDSSDASKGYDFRNCLECGLKMIEEHDNINGILKKQKLPSLDYRISADYGEVSIMETNNSSTIDVFGTPVNMCTKINHIADKNAIVIGSDLYRTVKKINDYQYNMINSCSVGMKYVYPVYSVQRKL
jgi:class 3 adenylate cyclase